LASNHLSPSQIDAIRRSVGLPVIFDYIAQAESSGDAGVINGIGATGLWQIYHHPDLVARFGSMTDPINNAKAAKALYDQSGLAPWAASRSKWSGHLGQGPLLGGSSAPVAANAAAAKAANGMPATAPSVDIAGMLAEPLLRGLLYVGLVGAGVVLAIYGTYHTANAASGRQPASPGKTGKRLAKLAVAA
jgi:hypothetical protein